MARWAGALRTATGAGVVLVAATVDLTGADLVGFAVVTEVAAGAVIALDVVVCVVGCAGLPVDIKTAPPTRTRSTAGAATSQGDVLDFLLMRP